MSNSIYRLLALFPTHSKKNRSYSRGLGNEANKLPSLFLWPDFNMLNSVRITMTFPSLLNPSCLFLPAVTDSRDYNASVLSNLSHINKTNGMGMGTALLEGTLLLGRHLVPAMRGTDRILESCLWYFVIA